MNCRDFLKIDHPEMISVNLDDGERCPDDFNYLTQPDYCCNDDDDCERCWNREIPIESVLAIKNNQIKKFEEKYRALEEGRDDLYKEFTEIVRERDALKTELETTKKEWEEEITCCIRLANDRIKEIETLKMIIRTVEAMTGGKILK